LGLFQDFFVKNKKTFPIHYIFIGGLAGLIPDLDIALYYLLSFFGFGIDEIHRTFSHNLFVPLFFVFLGLIFWKFKNKGLGKHHLKLKNIFFVIAFGIFMHLLLDATIDGMIIPFYPISNLTIGLNLISLFPLPWQNTIIPTIDAVLLILWMIYLETKHKISDFI
jgi:membrane-bound metal-dependent hydrolase YbcI (DUF457 family)